MAVRSGFWNSVGTNRRTYYNHDFSHLISLLIKDGIHQTYGNNFIVKPGSGMEIIVQTGEAWFNDTWVLNDSDLQLAIDPSPVVSGFKRIDAIAIKIDSRQSVMDGTIEYLKGTETAGTPAIPTMEDSDDIHWHLLATIEIAANDSTISASKITNYVGTTRTPFISGILSTISADILMNKWQGEFEEWFDHMKGQLDEDAAGHLQNEIDDINDNTRTNLLNPTAQTQTINGVTFTNNGDGTYTVNGTASALTTFHIGTVHTYSDRQYRLVGCPAGGSGTRYRIDNATAGNDTADYGRGKIWNGLDSDDIIRIVVFKNATVNNLIFKPMLTTDLNATYDDFIPYSGSGALNENVAEIYANKQNKIDNTLTTTAKTIIGAINELLGRFASYYTKTESDNLLANKTNTKVKGNAESTYRTGNVNLTPANIGAVAQSGDIMFGDLYFGQASVANTPFIRWRDNQHEVWAGITNSEGDWYLYDATRREAIVHARKNAQPVFNGIVAWGNVSGKPNLVQGYSVANQFYPVTSFGKFVDSNNLLANSGGGNLYWGGNAWSDERLKKNIDKTKVHGLESINKINVVEYDFIDNKKYGGFHEIGFIAQELEKIIPDAVLEVPADDEDKEKYGTDTLLTINNSNMIPYLVKSVQELSGQVDALTKRVEELERK